MILGLGIIYKYNRQHCYWGTFSASLCDSPHSTNISQNRNGEFYRGCVFCAGSLWDYWRVKIPVFHNNAIMVPLHMCGQHSPYHGHIFGQKVARADVYIIM